VIVAQVPWEAFSLVLPMIPNVVCILALVMIRAVSLVLARMHLYRAAQDLICAKIQRTLHDQLSNPRQSLHRNPLRSQP